MAAHEELGQPPQGAVVGARSAQDRERRIFQARAARRRPGSRSKICGRVRVSRERVRRSRCALSRVQKAVNEPVATMETPSAAPQHAIPAH